MPDYELEKIKERKLKGDKFVSNLYKVRIDNKLLGPQAKASKLYWCSTCSTLMTSAQSDKISCSGASAESSSYIGIFGNLHYHHTLSSAINLEAFIQYFRQKFRLCWKEIYLKISAIALYSQPE